MTTVTETIGTTARDHSTITLWEANLDDDPTYDSGDIAVGECYADSNFDEEVDINGGTTIGLTLVTLTVASAERHDGTAGTGAIDKITSTSGNQIIKTGTGRPYILSWLELDGNGEGLSLGFLQLVNPLSSNISTAKNLILHDNTAATGAAYAIFCSSRIGILNNIIYDVHSTSSGDAVNGIRALSAFNVNILNNTIHDIVASSSVDAEGIQTPDSGSTGFVGNNIVTDVSNAGAGAGKCYKLESPSNFVYSHNLASDTTASGTGSLDSKSAADQFVSTTGGAEDLHLKSGADAINAGTDLGVSPSGVEIDIDGRDRDAEGDTWDMGAHEFVAGGAAINLGLPVETDTATALAAIRIHQLGLSIETDTALAIIEERAVALGLVSETDAARAMTALRTNIVGMGIANEADTALALTILRTIALNIAATSASALSMQPDRAHSLGLPSESDTARSLGRLKVASVGIASETDTAESITVSGGGAVATLGVRGRSVRALTSFRLMRIEKAGQPTEFGLLGVAQEIVTALAMVVERSHALGIAQETDTTLAMLAERAHALGITAEVDTTLGILAKRVHALGVAQEVDTAAAMTIERVHALGITGETDTAIALTTERTHSVGIVTETDTALDMAVIQAAATIVGIGIATETSSTLRLLGFITIVADDFEAYDNLGDLTADPPNYSAQTQGTGNIISMNTDTDFTNGGNRSVKFTTVDIGDEGTDKCGLILDEVDFDPSFSFAEGDVISFRVFFYMVDPSVWPSSNEYLSAEDSGTGDGVRLGTTSTTGKFRFRRGQFGFTNETIDHVVAVGTFVEVELQFRMGILPTDDTYPNNGADFYEFDGYANGWYKLLIDGVIVGASTCTTMITGDTYNFTFGRGAIAEDAILYADDLLLRKAVG